MAYGNMVSALTATPGQLALGGNPQGPAVSQPMQQQPMQQQPQMQAMQQPGQSPQPQALAVGQGQGQPGQPPGAQMRPPTPAASGLAAPMPPAAGFAASGSPQIMRQGSPMEDFLKSMAQRQMRPAARPMSAGLGGGRTLG